MYLEKITDFDNDSRPFLKQKQTQKQTAKLQHATVKWIYRHHYLHVVLATLANLADSCLLTRTRTPHNLL